MYKQDGQRLHGVAFGSTRATERGQHCEHSVEADSMIGSVNE